MNISHRCSIDGKTNDGELPEATPLAGCRVLVTGASGLLGAALTRALREAGARVAGVRSTRPLVASGIEAHRCDLRDVRAVNELIDRTQPALIVHAAALTDIGLCEREPQLAHAVNVEATASVAQGSVRAGATLIYVSSEAVYGDGIAPHRESDPCRPLSVYAQTKLDGEAQALQHAPGTLVLRTTIVGTAPFDERSLVTWLIRSFRRGELVHGYEDVIFSPLFTADFSRLLIEAIGQALGGVWNLGARSHCSKLHFARVLANSLGFDPKLIQPARLAEADLRVPRCYQSALDSSRFAARIATELPTVEEGAIRFAEAEESSAIPHS